MPGTCQWQSSAVSSKHAVGKIYQPPLIWTKKTFNLRQYRIHTDGGMLHLAGMDSRYVGRPNLHSTLSGWKPNQPLIMMMHEPDVADDLAEAGVEALQLSGHTHGGQLRILGRPPPNYRRARWGKKYLAGLYDIGSVQLYVNRGIGCVGVPMRIMCPPEITEITLRSPLVY